MYNIHPGRGHPNSFPLWLQSDLIVFPVESQCGFQYYSMLIFLFLFLESFLTHGSAGWHQLFILFFCSFTFRSVVVNDLNDMVSLRILEIEF